MKLIKKVKVKNPMGLHTRPATYIVKMLQNNPNDIQFTYKKDTINAKSILGILMLAAKQNSQITITIEGENPQPLMDQLVAAFDTQFGE